MIQKITSRPVLILLLILQTMFLWNGFAIRILDSVPSKEVVRERTMTYSTPSLSTLSLMKRANSTSPLTKGTVSTTLKSVAPNTTNQGVTLLNITSCFRLFTNSVSFQAYVDEISADNSSNCYFITSNPWGRLGNQIFQLASLIGTAQRNDMIPVIPTVYKATNLFDLPNVGNFAVKNTKVHFYDKGAEYDSRVEHLEPGKNFVLNGYVQSWKYFKHINVSALFKIKDVHLVKARSFLKNVTKSDHQNVCIHVRKGDMTNERFSKLGYATIDAEFIKTAMHFYKQKLGKVQFVIISNDIKWCKGNINETVTYSPFTQPIEDLATMTLCDHVTVTSGTFGWWGAYLSRGTTVYYSGFPTNNTYLGNATNRVDYYPPEWTGLS